METTFQFERIIKKAMANTLQKLIALPFRYKPSRPEHFSIIVDDLKGLSKQPVNTDEVHLETTIDWLCRAQDQRTGQRDEVGVSTGWSFKDGWQPIYPETSGYIVETFIATEKILAQPEQLTQRAQRIIDWKPSIQNLDVSFPGHFGESGSESVIFNTGQSIQGMLAGYINFQSNECLEASVSTGRRMISKQDDDVYWRSLVHNDTLHTYNTRAAWTLLRTGLTANKLDLANTATKNIHRTLNQQTDSGWFKTNGFTADDLPFTHNIVYTVQGFSNADNHCKKSSTPTHKPYNKPRRIAGGALCQQLATASQLLLPNRSRADEYYLAKTAASIRPKRTRTKHRFGYPVSKSQSTHHRQNSPRRRDSWLRADDMLFDVRISCLDRQILPMH